MALNKSLPDGWKWTTVGDIVSFEYGKGLTKTKRDSSGDVPVYGSNGVVGYHSVALVDKPCLIIGRKGAAGAIHKSENPCWPIDTTYFVIPPENIQLSFIYYLFSNLNLGSLDRSTAIPGLNRYDAYSQIIPLPPLDQQERIVEKIETLFSQLDAGVTALKRTQTALKRYRASVLKAAFEGKLVPQDPADEPAELCQNILGKQLHHYENHRKLPDGWTFVKLADVCIIASGYTPNDISSFINGGEIPWYRVSDMNIKGNEKFMLAAQIELSNHDATLTKIRIMPSGTIIFPKRGGAIATNKKRILTKPSGYDLNIMGIKPINIDEQYFWYWLQSIDLMSLSNGSNVPQINHGDIEPLLIPFPPIMEQKRIVAEIEQRLSVIQELTQSVKANLLRATRLRQAVLKQAFEGKLVLQNPIVDNKVFLA